jgi:hypothetical protein
MEDISPFGVCLHGNYLYWHGERSVLSLVMLSFNFLVDRIVFTIATGGVFVNRIVVSLVDPTPHNLARKNIFCQIVARKR